MNRIELLLGGLLLLGAGCQRHEVPGGEVPLPVRAAECETSDTESGELEQQAAKPTTTLVRHLDPGDPDALCLALAGSFQEVAGVDPPPSWLEIVRRSFQPPQDGPPSELFSIVEPHTEQNCVTIYPPLSGLQPGEMPYGVSPEAELLWDQEQNLIVRINGYRETTIPREVLRGEMFGPDMPHAIHLLLADEETYVAVVGSFGTRYTLFCCDTDGEVKWKSAVWGNGSDRDGMPYAGLVFHEVTMLTSDDHLALFGHCTDGLYAECFERSGGAAELRWSSNNWFLHSLDEIDADRQ